MENSEIARVGEFRIDKGEWREGKVLYSWDGVMECGGSECPVSKRCGYFGGRQGKGQCGAQKAYLQSLLVSINKSYKYIDEAILWKIGMHLVPMYSILFRLKIEAMGGVGVSYVNDKGHIIMNPVFKEIRETLKGIHIMWKGLEMIPPEDPDESDPDIVEEDDLGGRRFKKKEEKRPVPAMKPATEAEADEKKEKPALRRNVIR